ncbi:MAG TPA: phage holin family protein [Pseudonocardiaceae bacterium]|nr:phage holin family protein [Pseudonocardiaceae bacterium]
MTSTQPRRTGRHAKQNSRPSVPSLPLSPERPPEPAQASLGELVREATTHLSTLLRSELELAKAELTAEVRKGVKGSIMFFVALSILLFSLFFLFFALGEILDVWLPRWAAFSIVFGVMLLAAGGFALFGWRRVRSVRKPERTITTVKETGEVFSHLRPDHQHDGHPAGPPRPGQPAPGPPQHGQPPYGRSYDGQPPRPPGVPLPGPAGRQPPQRPDQRGA